jgi:hypothetical protein
MITMVRPCRMAQRAERRRKCNLASSTSTYPMIVEGMALSGFQFEHHSVKGRHAALAFH